MRRAPYTPGPRPRSTARRWPRCRRGSWRCSCPHRHHRSPPERRFRRDGGTLHCIVWRGRCWPRDLICQRSGPPSYPRMPRGVGPRSPTTRYSASWPTPRRPPIALSLGGARRPPSTRSSTADCVSGRRRAMGSWSRHSVISPPALSRTRCSTTRRAAARLDR